MSEPPDAETLLEVLKELGGDSRYARLIDSARAATLEVVEFDNWNGGTNIYELELSVSFDAWKPFRGMVPQLNEDLLAFVSEFWSSQCRDWLRVNVRPGAPRRLPYLLDPKPIGRGGVGEVFGAIHRDGGPRVAFKRLRTEDTEARERLRREIDVHRRLQHPNIMPVLDHDPGFEWFTMPLAVASLATCPDVRIEEVALHVAQGLVHAHGNGLVHRDIAPGNVLLLESGAWVVADWGLVRRPRGHTTKLLTGVPAQVS